MPSEVHDSNMDVVRAAEEMERRERISDPNQAPLAEVMGEISQEVN